MAYFLVSVSTRRHLDLCVKYALAGFLGSINGAWAFCEIQEGDYISFLYAARAHNLYRVQSKEAFRNAHSLPPWEPVKFKMSGITFDFPFRLRLVPVRRLDERLVREEFAYVAENLLLRGGYRKSHFQADQTTFQRASQLGELHSGGVENLTMGDYEPFTLRFCTNRDKSAPPELYPFTEVILQAVLRQHLSREVNLGGLFRQVGLESLDARRFEVLGEKALAEGHLDILVKQAVPMGTDTKVIIEVKTGPGNLQHIKQLSQYVHEVGRECRAGVLLARSFSKRVLDQAASDGISPLRYGFNMFDTGIPATFSELLAQLPQFHV